MTKFEMPETIRMQFLGDLTLDPKRTRYRGDGLLCDLEHKDSCLVDVSPPKAKQLFQDDEKCWKIPGDAAKAAQIKKALKELPEPTNLETGAAVQAIDGVAKILMGDGTEIVLPAGSRVTVEVGR